MAHDDVTWARDFGRLEGKVDSLIQQISNLNTDISSDLAEIKESSNQIHLDQEDRLRKLEKWAWGIPSSFIMALVAFFFGFS